MDFDTHFLKGVKKVGVIKKLELALIILLKTYPIVREEATI